MVTHALRGPWSPTILIRLWRQRVSRIGRAGCLLVVTWNTRPHQKRKSTSYAHGWPASINSLFCVLTYDICMVFATMHRMSASPLPAGVFPNHIFGKSLPLRRFKPAYCGSLTIFGLWSKVQRRVGDEKLR